MRIQKHIAVAGLILLLALLVSACSASIGGNTNNLTAQDVLQKSASAMQNLKSSHVDANANVQASGTNAQAGNTPSSASFSVNASGVQQLPQQMQLSVNLNTLSQTTKVNEILTSDKVYVQNPQNGQWYYASRQELENTGSNYFSGITIDTKSLLASLQSIKLTDHGDETLNGQSLRHITADIDKNTFQKLVQDNPQLKSYFGQQDINTFLNNVKSFSSTVDVWIDEQQFYLHQVELKLNTTGNPNAIAQGTATATPSANSSLTVKLDSTVKLSQFNQPVSITPPAQATPVNNPKDLFGTGTQQ